MPVNLVQEGPNYNAIQQAEAAKQAGEAFDAAKQRQSALAQLIKGKQLEASNKTQEMNDSLTAMKKLHGIDPASPDSDKSLAQDLKKGGAGFSVGSGTFHEFPDPSVSAARNVQAERLKEKQMEGLSKRYEKHQGFDTSLNELEALTNKDGKGGVLTNQAAELKSAGKLANAVPSAGMGIAELIAPEKFKGVSDERKALERLKLEYQKSMSGLRVTDQARKQEGQAMGWMASGDPALVAKGVRALARLHRDSLKTIQGGYTSDVRDSVHQGMGGNPSDSFANVYNDNAQPQAPQASPPPGAAPAQDPAMQRYLDLKKKYGR